ncbi:Protein disulfide-isomerase tigA, partial [Teratosphaeria destructans]
VASLKTGGDAAYRAFADAVATTQDKTAEYYGKVARKAEENAGYAQKELARLQGLLAKGGLAPEKLDDLTTRSNILRRFVGDEPAKDEL